MIKTLQRKLKQDKEPFNIPRSVQGIIPVDRVWKDGVFQSGEYFSQTYSFDDVNYAVASKEDKEAMFRRYEELLNSLDSGSTAKITVVNRQYDRKQFEESVLAPYKNDGKDYLRDEYNKILTDCASDANGIVQDKYITISVPKRSISSARSYLHRSAASLEERLSDLNSRCRTLDLSKRLCLLHDFIRQGESSSFNFDIDNAMRSGISFKDCIVPDSFAFKSDHFQMGSKFARVLNLRIEATFIKDDFIKELCEINKDMILSIDIVTVPTDEAVREVQSKLLGTETNITNWQRRQNANQNFAAVVPYDMEQQRKESTELLDDLTARDQRMMFALVTIIHTANTKEALDTDTETLQTIARQRLCTLAVLKYQQKEGFQTALPFGVTRIDNCWRTLTTESTAILIPFNVQEISHPGGIYCGINAISRNLILCNRSELINPAGFFLGIPGSGKSMGAKFEIMLIRLLTDDIVYVLDPEAEYSEPVKALGGSVIKISAGSGQHINAMDMVAGYSDNKDSVIDKSQFVMSVFEQLVGTDNLGPREKSIIDRCVRNVYDKFERDGKTPCLPDLRAEILRQPEEIAKGLALVSELFTDGSLDTFAHPTNVDMQSNLISFDIHDLGRQLKTLGLLVVTDFMLNSVTRNFHQGKRTHLYFDEFHVVFENEHSSSFFNSAWRRFRKRNAHVNGITQNIEYLLDSVTARTMLSNSEYIVMYNQSASDRAELARLLNISSQQLVHITNSKSGNGLLRVGSALVPFINQIPKDTDMYRLMTTKPSEVVGS